jgi:FixJ family two-component response regulator
MIREPILLVDDEDDLRSFLKESLTLDGYLVEDAADANAALALMAARHFPVVLTDLNMPGGPTGFDLITAVKARDPQTLCVVITGYASMETAIQAVKFGAYDFVQKPFKLAEMEAILDRALNHATVLRQLEDYQHDLEERVLARVEELKAVHSEVLKLNDLLMDSQGELQEVPLLSPFLEHLTLRFGPLGTVVLRPTLEDGWETLLGTGPEPLAPAELPTPPSALADWQECRWNATYPDGFLVPLRRGDTCLGAVFLGFGGRNAFHPEDPTFLLWRRQVEAALHGLGRLRAHLASQLP